MALTARALRNRVITILNNNDAMRDVELAYEEKSTLPAILFKQGKGQVLILFIEVPDE